MTQNQLNREVAQATGETVEFVRKRGFGIVITPRRRFRPRGGGAQASVKRPVKPTIQQLKAA